MARTITMKRNKHGQFVAARMSAAKKNPHRRKKARARKNYVGAAPIMLANPKRRRARAHPMRAAKRRHRARHNPPSIQQAIKGMDFPISMIAGLTAGLIGPSIVKGAATQMFPTYAAQYPTVLTVVSYAIPPAAAYVVDGKRGLRNVLIAEAAAYAAKLIAGALTAGGVAVSTNGMGRNLGPVRRAQLNGKIGPVSRQMLNGKIGPVPFTKLNAGRYNNRAERFNSRF